MLQGSSTALWFKLDGYDGGAETDSLVMGGCAKQFCTYKCLACLACRHFLSSAILLTMSTEENPPSFEANTVNLVSIDDSKIISVSLYSGRAEITRLFKFPVKIGQNQVNVTGKSASTDAPQYPLIKYVVAQDFPMFSTRILSGLSRNLRSWTPYIDVC